MRAGTGESAPSAHDGQSPITHINNNEGGAPSGIGAIYADRLAKRGYDLILVARRFNRLRTLADKIAGETERKVEVIAAITK